MRRGPWRPWRLLLALDLFSAVFSLPNLRALKRTGATGIDKEDFDLIDFEAHTERGKRPLLPQVIIDPRYTKLNDCAIDRQLEQIARREQQLSC